MANYGVSRKAIKLRKTLSKVAHNSLRKMKKTGHSAFVRNANVRFDVKRIAKRFSK